MTGAYTLEEDFALLKGAVEKAGKQALKGLGRDDLKTWLKKGYEPVTETDLAIDRLLHEALAEKRPGYGWLSEESASDPARFSKDKVWIVDPIDGTRAFIRGHDDFSITGALIENRRPVAGVIFAPARNEFYAAMKGKGAFLNGQRIRVSGASAVTGMKMQGDDAYFKSTKNWNTPWPEMDFGKYQSFALRIAAVAAGAYDAAVSARPKSEWDVAAGDLIVAEAGGVCVDGDGNPFRYNNENTRVKRIVAAAPGVKDEILTLLEGRKPKNTSSR